jgi:hypothetical protein
MCRRNSIRRERLEFTATPDGAVDVVNGLGADIEQLWYCDANGTFHEVVNVKAGQKERMNTNLSLTAAKNRAAVRKLFTDSFKNHMNDALKTAPQNYMVPGTYVALLKGAPFMEHGLGERNVHLTAESIIYGTLAKETQQ